MTTDASSASRWHFLVVALVLFPALYFVSFSGSSSNTIVAPEPAPTHFATTPPSPSEIFTLTPSLRPSDPALPTASPSTNEHDNTSSVLGVEPWTLPSLASKMAVVDATGRERTVSVSPMHSTCFRATAQQSVESSRCGVLVNAAATTDSEATLKLALSRVAAWSNMDLMNEFPVHIIACAPADGAARLDRVTIVTLPPSTCARRRGTPMVPPYELLDALPAKSLPWRYTLYINVSVQLPTSGSKGRRRSPPPVMSFFLLDFYDVLLLSFPKADDARGALRDAAERTGNGALTLAAKVGTMAHPAMFWLRDSPGAKDFITTWKSLASEYDANCVYAATAVSGASLVPEMCSMSLAVMAASARHQWVAPFYGRDSRFTQFDPCRYERSIDRPSEHVIADLGAT